ncbi:methylation [Shewanella denitrificans OS217]|uniref:Methylation n=1 Tax=Shewanella denitrificans (strain OS217 / ATCC BAA-1090 / DSM 15013) TaxID=318161 RepID=Q12IW0_SHEDO|nr:prepilin-type N-terminal cleavage/methylation domain-containing protein [Shewanella denitrificans]ABE56616.1 methylation [Shewanella denitrificans OS217]
MKRQQGFTLIELVVVIIILGILAVTAAPKFMNLQGDARIAALDGLEGALKGANSIIHSKSIIAGTNTLATSTVNVGGTTTVSIAYGYITSGASVADIETNIEAALDIDFQQLTDNTTTVTSDWGVRRINDATFRLIPQSRTANPAAASACYLQYTRATNTLDPVYLSVTTGC